MSSSPEQSNNVAAAAPPAAATTPEDNAGGGGAGGNASISTSSSNTSTPAAAPAGNGADAGAKTGESNGANGGSGESARPPPKKRNRLALSCTSCRERKVKCNRTVPCDQCMKRGDPHLCHIEPFKHKAAEAREKEKAAREALALGLPPPPPLPSSQLSEGVGAGAGVGVGMESSGAGSISPPNAAIDPALQSLPPPMRTSPMAGPASMPSAASAVAPKTTTSRKSSGQGRKSNNASSNGITANGGVGAGNMVSVEQQEMHAIKARLAQLEALLEAKAAASSSSNPSSSGPAGTNAGGGGAAPTFAPGSPRAMMIMGNGAAAAAASAPYPSSYGTGAAGSPTGTATASGSTYVYPVTNFGQAARISSSSGGGGGGSTNAFSNSMYDSSATNSAPSPYSSTMQQFIAGSVTSPGTSAAGSANATNAYSSDRTLPPFNNIFGRSGTSPAANNAAAVGGANSSSSPGAAGMFRGASSSTDLFDPSALRGSPRSAFNAGAPAGANTGAGTAVGSGYRPSVIPPPPAAAHAGAPTPGASVAYAQAHARAQHSAVVAREHEVAARSHTSESAASGKDSRVRDSTGRDDSDGPRYIHLPNGHVRMEIDSDTEDAALVLEGLATGNRAHHGSPANTAGVGDSSRISVSRLVNAAEGCPSLRSTAAVGRSASSSSLGAGGAAAASSVRTPVAGPGRENERDAASRRSQQQQGATACEQAAAMVDSEDGGAPARTDLNSSKDILDPDRMSHFETALHRDKKVDLMLPVAEGGTSRDADEVYVPPPPSAAADGWQQVRMRKDAAAAAGEKGATSQGGAANADGEDAEMPDGTAKSTGAPNARADSTGKDGDKSRDALSSTTSKAGAAASANDKDGAEQEKAAGDAEDEEMDPCGNTSAKDNGACGAYTSMCKLACENDGLFRLKQGPETLLGWGMGWSWGAAEAKGDFRTIKGSFCPGSAEREAVLRAIIRTLPNKEIAAQLVDVYAARVFYLAGHVVHIPTLRREMEAFYTFDSVEKQARVLNYVDPAWLSMFLMILVLGLQFYPCYPPDHYINIQHLFDGKTIHLWYSAHKSILILARYQCSQSISVLQAILLADLHGAEHERTLMSLLRTAITNAQEMGLHRLGDKARQPKPDEAPGTTILREMYKRIWWSLVWRDWITSMKNSGVYTIHPGQFNTPYPGNYNDEDLCQSPLPPPRPQSEHTEMSFVLSKLMIADAVRENTDLLNQRDYEANRDGSSRHLTCQDTSRLDARYRAILENAPSFFQVGSDAGAGTDIEVQRWLLQQGVFSKLLRLHRVGLSSKTKSRTSCVLLARSILDMQKKLRSRCTVVDRLWFILVQSFNAAVVLCLDLFSTPSPPAMREIIRSEIAEALDSLRLVESTNSNVSRSIRILEALLAEEEAQWKRRHNAASNLAGSKRKRDEAEEGQKRKAVLSLALRVKRAVEGHPLPEDAEGSATAGSSSSDGMPHKDEFAKELMGQILKPQLNEDASSAVAFPYLVSNTEAYPNDAPIAPNGVVSMPFTPPDGQPFDLSTFLAQYSGSPTSGSDDIHSLLSSSNSAAGRSPVDSSSSTRSLQASSSSTDLTSQSSHTSHGSRQPSMDENKTAQQTFVGQDSSNPTTGLDGFWDWIFSQGGAQQPQPAGVQQQVAATPVATTEAGASTPANAPLTSQATSEPQNSAANATVAPTPESYFAQIPGGAPLLNGSLLPTPMPVSQPEGPMTPSKAAGVTGLEGFNDPYGINQTNPETGSVKAGTPYSVGTPSSGWDSWFATSLESFMQA